MIQNQILGNKIVCSNEAHRKQNLQIIAICLENDCQMKRTLCSQCFENHDKNHQIIELQHLQEQLEIQHKFVNQKRSEQYQNLSKLQNQCFKIMQEKLQNMAQDATQTKKLSEQKIEAEQKQSYISNYKNEEDLEKLQYELQNKVSKEIFNPQLTKLLFDKNILFGYERYIRQLLFDASLFSNSTDYLEECEFFSDDQLMNLRNLCYQINEIRQQVIVGFQDEQQNMLYLQSVSEQLNQRYSIYSSQLQLKQQQDLLSDEQKQYFNNLVRLPIGQILQNYPLEQLNNNQFKLIYSSSFQDIITLKQINSIKDKSNEKSLICIGAVKQNDHDKFHLCAIDYVEDVFQPVNSYKVARKSRKGQMYWYYKYGLFCGIWGFSPVPEIEIGHQLNIHYDKHNLDDQLRFSMQVNYKSDCRVGRDREKELLESYIWQLYLRV